MSLRLRVQKLIDQQRMESRESYFVIAQSKEQEVEEVNKIKAAFRFDESLLMITVFKLYD